MAFQAISNNFGLGVPTPMGHRLAVAVGLMGSEDPADSAF